MKDFLYEMGVWVNFLCVDFYSLSQKLKLKKNQNISQPIAALLINQFFWESLH